MEVSVDRNERRYRALRYQARQIRLERDIKGKPYDPERKTQSARGKRAQFIAYLKGNVYKPYDVGLYNYPNSDPKRLGRMKRQSWDDCGRRQCRMCGNPRHSGWYKYWDKVTQQEIRADYRWEDELELVFSEEY
jgi:hypothetical protein